MASQQFALSYLDFVPVCLKNAGFLRLPEFERFDVLIARANDWLAANPGIKVKNVESLELPWNSYMPDRTMTVLDNEASMFYEAGKAANCYVRALRLWIMSKVGGDDPAPVRLGYYNVVPACLKSGGIFSLPEFERFDVTLNKLNDMLASNPLQGQIINIETQDMKFENWGDGVDPDCSFWAESGKAGTCFLYVLRIFYQGGPPAMERIGSVDIVPQVTGKGLSTIGEPYSVIFQRANQWLAEHPGIKVTNMQSLNYKMSVSFWGGSSRGADTMATLYIKAGKAVTVFCRIIRIFFLTSAESQNFGAMPALSYRSFMPALVRPSGSSLIYNPKFETMTQNMGRLVAWLNHTGARVVSAESVKMLIKRNGVDPEATITFDSGNMTDVWLFLFRLHLDGHYPDPPPGVLPPPPPQEEPQGVDCCTLL